MDGLISLEGEEEEEEGNARRDNTDAIAGDDRYDEKARHVDVEQTQLMDATRTLLWARGAIMSTFVLSHVRRVDSIPSQVNHSLHSLSSSSIYTYSNHKI
jgi:hypothetical protein